MNLPVIFVPGIITNPEKNVLVIGAEFKVSISMQTRLLKYVLLGGEK